MATNKQIGTIYGLGTKCGLYEAGNKKDGLHKFVWQLTLKQSIKELTTEEAARVINHLHDNLQAIQSKIPPPPALMSEHGAITEQQIKKIFGLAYELQGYDKELSKASVRQRVAGVMKKVLETDPPMSGDILKGINFRQGEIIIEELKRYVRNAKRKAVKNSEKSA